jgi:hypothetical protein
VGVVTLHTSVFLLAHNPCSPASHAELTELLRMIYWLMHWSPTLRTLVMFLAHCALGQSMQSCKYRLVGLLRMIHRLMRWSSTLHTSVMFQVHCSMQSCQ